MISTVFKKVRLIGAVASIVASSWAVGMEVLLETELRVAVKYDDNINLEVDNQDSLYGEEINPKAKLTMRTETWSSQASLDLRFPDFNRPGYESDDQYFTLSTTRLGERSKFSLQARATHDSTRTSEEQDSGRFSDERHNGYAVIPAWSYSLSPKNLIQLQASASIDDYENPQYTGYDVVGGSADWIYSITEKASLILGGNASKVEFDDANRTNFGLVQIVSSETTSSGYQVGFEYQWTEKLSVDGRFGRSDTKRSADIETTNAVCNLPVSLYPGLCFQEDRRSKTKKSSANITWDGERHTFNLGYSIDTQPSSDGYVLEYERVNLGWSFRLVENGKVELTGTWGENTVLDEAENQQLAFRSNRTFVTTIARYTHRLTEHWYLNTSIRYRQQDRESQLDQAEGTGASLGVSYFFDKYQW